MDRIESRKKSFKKGIDPADARKRRENENLSLRKSRREENHRKRRNLGGDPAAPVALNISEQQQQQQLQGDQNNPISPPLLRALFEGTQQQQLEALVQIRSMLATEHHPPIQQVIDAKLIPHFTAYLRPPLSHQCPALCLESSWILTNITSGTSEQTLIVADAGAISAFAELLVSNAVDDNIKEQAIWALGNIAGDCVELRDRVLATGALVPLCESSKWEKLSMVRTGVWALSNLCRGRPQPFFSFVQPALPTLVHHLYSNDEEILTDTCWALQHISRGSDERRQAIIEIGACRRVVNLTMHENIDIKLAALRIVGNIVSGTNMQTQIVLSVGVLPCLYSLVQHLGSGRVRKEACWIVSNITAGDADQIQKVISANFLPILVNIVKTDEFSIRKEACFALCNITLQGQPHQIRKLIQEGAIQPLCSLLTNQDVTFSGLCLEGIQRILEVGKSDLDDLDVPSMVESAGGLEAIEQLQNHQNDMIATLASKVYDSYFSEDAMMEM
mmetsp:Transcript_6096/g.9239  ORF Transcript_6096/g.9239 Transcript_6096/m.9239 type:complete len:503 (-) Transcript_6096:82-1590(-)|eukprot:CAMPEP_0201509312 /NCGR_PEP_ID=MMETSP0161_2-20130828/2408_1 /ASSEMBLY_ACC=CAM_ASM_000251 /TAXON_ID=180227 /ORGANISM="Neoparamoeba aestuarina, Strain SoJaBio B1-5/56/2" /LENGTH=502 /DNA_ID=CAMNT_0047904231 /DNA_START=49 /DNA_END=1557 /DNA_ORIENTATION=-